MTRVTREFNRRIKHRAVRRCRRCGKRWCGTDLKLRKLYPESFASDVLSLDDRITDRVTFGSKKCRNKGPKR